MRKISYTNDSSKHAELLDLAEHILIDDAPISPLYFKSNTYLVKRRVKGWHSNLTNIHPWKFVTVEN